MRRLSRKNRKMRTEGEGLTATAVLDILGGIGNGKQNETLVCTISGCFAFITIIPTPVDADATVCQIVGGDGYSSLEEALSEATMRRRHGEVAGFRHGHEGIRAADKDVTIDLNGFTLTVTDGDSHALYAKDGFTLTIDDADGDGKVIASLIDTVFSPAYAETGGVIAVKGDLTAAYESGAGGEIIAVYAKDDSEITVNGTVSGDQAAIYACDSAKVSVSGDVAGMVVVGANAAGADQFMSAVPSPSPMGSVSLYSMAARLPLRVRWMFRPLFSIPL